MSRAAFSLVELSIVLVILGLLVGGVLGGQSLIKAAEERKFMKSLEEFRGAVFTFYEKYNAYPGDMTNAFDYWNTNCADTAPHCNGDGNGLIGTAYANAGWNTNPESINFYGHLKLSNISNIRTTGYPGTTGSYYQVGTDIPEFVFYGGKFGLWPIQIPAGWPYGERRTPNSFLRTAGRGGAAPAWSLFPGFEAWSMDIKYDDGLPTTGMIHSRGSNSGCTIGYSAYDKLETSASDTAGQGCVTDFWAGF